MAGQPHQLPPQLARAMQAYQSGHFRAAIDACEGYLRHAPRDANALQLLTLAHANLGDDEAALEAARRALAVSPQDRTVLQAAARMHARRGEFDAARAALQTAIGRFPDDPGLRAALADVLFDAGDFAEAGAALAPVLAAAEHHGPVAQVFAKICPRLRQHREGIAVAERCLSMARLLVPQRVDLLFSIGHLYDALGEYDRAFDAYRRANSFKLPRPFVAEYAASLDRMLAAWTPQATRAAPRSEIDSDLPVYIVGMPRSGTSLVEQIIASHPQVFGAGERQDVQQAVEELQADQPAPRWHMTTLRGVSREALSQRARRIVAALESRGHGRARVSDKFPMNCLHLGPLSLLLPRARVIYCRRDPVDNCVSCYFHNLGGPHAFNSDLTLLGRWYRQHERVMAHWRGVVDLPIADAPYEALVESQAEESRRLIEFLGLPWDAACLRFHETRRITLTPSADQVRQPIYRRAIGRWKNYERHLQPLLDALGEGGLDPSASAR